MFFPPLGVVFSVFGEINIIQRGVCCRKEVFYNKDNEAVEQLPEELVDVPSLEPFRVSLDGALSNVIEL